MVGTRIDDMRQRWHTGAKLRFLKLSDDKTKLEIIAELSEGFVLTREYKTEIKQLTGTLTFELRGNTTLTPQVLRRDALFVDYVHADNTTFDRWKFETKTPPQQYTDRFVCYLGAAFNDKTPILV